MRVPARSLLLSEEFEVYDAVGIGEDVLNEIVYRFLQVQKLWPPTQPPPPLGTSDRVIQDTEGFNYSLRCGIGCSRINESYLARVGRLIGRVIKSLYDLPGRGSTPVHSDARDVKAPPE